MEVSAYGQDPSRKAGGHIPTGKGKEIQKDLDDGIDPIGKK